MMAQTQDLKRQLIRQAVADNLALIAGRRRVGEAVRRRRRSRRWRWRLGVLGLAVAVVGTAFAMRQQRVDAPPAAAEPSSLILPSVPAAAAPAPRPKGSRWAEDPSSQNVRLPERMDTSVLPLRVRHVVIDPGHGGEDRGTRSDGLMEKELTLDVGLRLRDLLRAESFQVSMTRTTDVAMSLRERVEVANRLDADVFVSIHINWIKARQVRGIETYFLGSTEDPELKELARLENRDSGYSLADQKRLIEGILLYAHHERSRQLATRIQRALYGSLLAVNPSLRNRGVKTAPFVVLVGTAMPGVLTEVSCLSNAEEARLLARPLYREHIAEALARGIRAYAEDVNQSAEKGS